MAQSILWIFEIAGSRVVAEFDTTAAQYQPDNHDVELGDIYNEQVDLILDGQPPTRPARHFSRKS